MGSWIQNTGQQWLVYDLTGSKQALGLITFIGAAPMFFLSPFGGWLTDRSNKRVVLITAQVLLALGALVLAAAVWFHFVSFNLIAVLAFINGCISVIEIPTRQATISHIVPPEELANALPLSSATFNAARIIGPVVGGLLLSSIGPAACYFINGISFAAIIFSIAAISADLRSTSEQSASLKETLFEGIFHVFRTPAFRTLALMMMCTAVFGLFYISMLSAFAVSVLKQGPQGYASLLTATGVGAMASVFIIAGLSRKPVKGWVPLISMVGLGASLFTISFVKTLVPAQILLALVGLFGLGQMVGTNTALQYFSPPELRGRIVSVHVWSLAGLSPLGALFFGSFSEKYGLPLAFQVGGGAVMLFGIVALIFARSVKVLA